MAWYPLGGKGMTAELLNSEVIKSLANKYNKSSAQIVLRWHIEMGNIVIPGSKNVEHIRDNLNIFDFELSSEDMASIASLDNETRRYVRTDESLEAFQNWHITYEKE